MALVLAKRLSRLATVLENRAGRGLTVKEAAALTEEVHLLARLADHQEAELRAHRLGEADRVRRETMEDEAGKSLRQLATDTDGIVVRPDFGRRS